MILGGVALQTKALDGRTPKRGGTRSTGTRIGQKNTPSNNIHGSSIKDKDNEA